jgi:hypothetical protein
VQLAGGRVTGWRRIGRGWSAAAGTFGFGWLLCCFSLMSLDCLPLLSEVSAAGPELSVLLLLGVEGGVRVVELGLHARRLGGGGGGR